MTDPVGSRALVGAVGGLRFATGLSFDFEPSIGILAAKVNKLGLDISDFKDPLTRSIQQVMIPSFEENFASGGRPAWEPLSEYAVKQRGSSRPILVRTGALKTDATSLGIWHITDKAASIQTWPASSWYAQIHQAGYGSASNAGATSARKGTGVRAAKIHIPARPFIMFQPEDVEDIRGVFMEWLEEKLDAVGRLR